MLFVILLGMVMTTSCSKDDDDDNKFHYSYQDPNGKNDNTPHYELKECTSCKGTGICKMAGLGCEGTGNCGGCMAKATPVLARLQSSASDAMARKSANTAKGLASAALAMAMDTKKWK